MIFTIRDKSLDVVGDIDEAISKIWDKDYRADGYVEIYAAQTPRNSELLQEGFYITRPDDPCVARIYAVKTDTDEENGDVIMASAKFSHYLLGRRIIWNPTKTTGTAENTARALITDNCLSPVDRSGNPMRERIIDVLTLADAHGLPDILGNSQVSYKNLLEYVREICATFHYGLRAIMESEHNQIAIDIYKGIDRSYRQTALPYVVLSQENENLLGFSYKYDSSPTINVALVGGEGEGVQRTVASVGSATGIERCEVFVDAKDISNTVSNEDGTTSTPYTPEQYAAMLRERGLLNMVPPSESFDAAVDLSRSYKYREDFDVGDIVTVHNIRTGAYVNVRLMGVLEVEDANGYTLTPTFSTDY